MSYCILFRSKMKRKHCSGDCNFKSYYLDQAGKGFTFPVFRGTPYQRGYGIGSVFKRYAIPIAQYLGRKLLKAGLSVGTDFLQNQNLKDSIKTQAKSLASSVATDGLHRLKSLSEQKGFGRYKRKKRLKKNPRRLRKVKDIFD